MNVNRTSRPPRPYVLTVLLFSMGYVTYFLSKGVFVALAAPVLLVLTPFPKARYRFLQVTMRGFLTVFARGWLPALGLYRIVEVSGLERVLAFGPGGADGQPPRLHGLAAPAEPGAPTGCGDQSP